jgi:hypothetical protein
MGLRVPAAKTLGLAIIVMLLASIVFLFFNWVQSPTSDRSWSISQAKRNGTFVSQLKIVPQQITWQGKRIQFREVWVEERVEKSGNSFFPYKRTGDFAICFTLSVGEDIFFENDNPFFVLEENGSGFLVTYGDNEPILFRQIVENAQVDKMRISLIKSWSDRMEKNIRLIMPQR